MIDGIKQLGEQLAQIKKKVFAKRDKPEVAAAIDAQPPEDEDREIRAARRKNEKYGEDPKLIELYSRRFMKIGAVFEEEEDKADSWQGKSVEADVSSGGQNISIGSVQLRDSDAQVASVKEDRQSQNNGDRRQEVGQHVMGPISNIKFASHRHESVPNANVDTRDQAQRPNQRFNLERVDVDPAAQEQEEEKKAAQPLQPRRPADHAEVPRVQERVQVLRGPADANAALVEPVRVQVVAVQQRAARGAPETDEMIDRCTWQMCDVRR